MHMPLPRFEIGVGHGLYNGLRSACACLGLHSGWGYFYKNSLRCARVCLGLRSGWGMGYIMACALHVPALVCTRGGALFKEMLRPKGSLGPRVKVIP